MWVIVSGVLPCNQSFVVTDGKAMCSYERIDPNKPLSSRGLVNWNGRSISFWESDEPENDVGRWSSAGKTNGQIN